MLDVADFIFPRDLQVTETKISRCLVIGSCMAEDYVKDFKKKNPSVEVDFILFNNADEISDRLPRPINEYDFQFIQIPARSVIGDGVIRFPEFSSDKLNADIVENARNMLRVMLDSAFKFHRDSNIVTFVQNFIIPQMPAVSGLRRTGTSYDLRRLFMELNFDILEYIEDLDNVYLIDAENIAASMGKRFFFDDTLSFFTHGGFWFSDWIQYERGRLERVPRLEVISDWQLEQFLDAIWRAIEYNYRIINQVDSIKLVVFDLDDTLWRGLVGDHYGDDGNYPVPLGWPMGVHEAIHHLKARGILVAICSKNDLALVTDRWDRTVPFDWIKLGDFVSAEIGWEPKAESIRKIMSEVNLTPKNVLFVDDNPVERQAVKSAFPDIRVIGGNPFLTRRVLLASPETQVNTLTAESAQRDELIRRGRAREQERAAMSREEFLKTLNCKVELRVVEGPQDKDFARAFELLNKTNQFNTTGKRWSLSEINIFFERVGKIFVFTVADRFTAYGLVGVLLVQGAEIIQFVMSCRVLGLGVETSVLHEIARHVRSDTSGAVLTTKTVDTDANLASRDVFGRSGFMQYEAGKYRWQQASIPEIPVHLSLSWVE